MQRILNAQSQQKKDYEQRYGLKREFKVDDEVLVYNLRRADRKGDKGKEPWDGPYKVAKVIQDKGLYQLTTLDGKQIKTKQI